MAEIDDALAAVSTLAVRVCAGLSSGAGDDESGVAGSDPLVLQAPPLEVVVCGEYGRGKSTLLSALAGRRQLFPHESGDTTSIATTLSWGERAEAVITFAGGQDGAVTAPRRETVPLDEIRRYMTEAGNRRNEQTVALVELHAPLESLAWGLTLIDTPGVNSRHEAHNLTTRQYLSRADVILFVASADGPLSELELGAVGRAAVGGAHILAVLAKADLSGASQLRDSAAERLGRELGHPVEVLEVSAVKEFEGREEHIPRLRSQSHVPALLERLQQLGAAHRARFARSAVAELRRFLAERRGLAVGELTVLNEARENADTLEYHLASLRADIEALNDTAEIVLREVGQNVDHGIDLIRGTIAARCEELKLHLGLEKVRRRKTDPGAFERELLDGLARIADQADRERVDLMARIVVDTEDALRESLSVVPQLEPLRSGLRLEPGEARSTDKPRLSLDAVRQGMAGGAVMASGAGSVGAIIGGLIGLAPGAAVGALVGGLIGHLVGIVGGTLEAARSAAQEESADQLRVVAERAPELIADVKSYLDARLDTMRTVTAADVQREIELMLGRRRGRCELLIQRSELNRERRPTDWLGRAEEIAGELDRLDDLDRDLDEADDRLRRLSSLGGHAV